MLKNYSRGMVVIHPAQRGGGGGGGGDYYAISGKKEGGCRF